MKYKVIKERIGNSDIRAYNAYGIEITEKGKSLRRISDVSLSFKAIYKLCKKCNRLKLDPEHIDYVIEDFLVSNNGR